MRDSNCEINIGILKMYLSRGTHWVAYINESCFDSFGCPPSKISTNHKTKKWKKCFCSNENSGKRQ